MKRRTFYIINLDRNRLFIMTVLFVGLLAAAYATGFRLGRAQGPGVGVEALSYQDLMGTPDPARQAGAYPGEGVYVEGEVPGALPGPDGALPPEEGSLPGPNGALPLSDPLPTGEAGEALAPKPLERSGNNDDARARERREREEAAERKREIARAKAAERKRKLAEARERKERERKERQQREREIARRKAAEKARLAARNSDENKGTIGQSVGRDSRFNNKGQTRLAFEKKRTEKSESSREREPTRERESREKNTVSLRNVAPSAAEKRPSARKRSEREYSLQLGSFSSKEAAYRMASSLKRQGFNPYVYRSGGKFAVRVGKTDQPGHLETLEQRLRNKRYSPMRISYNKPDR